MMREITLDALLSELNHDPDLRRLGDYKVRAGEAQTIFPIDIDFGARTVNLGSGDFTDGFVAFSGSKAKDIDLGTSKFYDLYLDDLEAERLALSGARASRLYFDQARLADCSFHEFVAAEIYFDEATIGTMRGDRLQAGIVYLEGLQGPNLRPGELRTNVYRLVDSAPADISHDQVSEELRESAREVRVITTDEFRRYFAEDQDLSRLGEYKVVGSEHEASPGELAIECHARGRTIIFGQGDFSDLKLRFGESEAARVDFSGGTFETVDFQNCTFGECFLGEARFLDIRFGEANIGTVFGESGTAAVVNLERLRSLQFHGNEISVGEFHMGEARVNEMYMSRGEKVQAMFCEGAELDLLNLHEGQIREVHFGESHVQRALINKAHIEGLYVEGLRASKLYIGNDGHNEIGRLEFQQTEGIREFAFSDALLERDGRAIIRDIEGLASRYPREARAEIEPPIQEQDFERTLEARRPTGPEGERGGERF